MGKLDGKLDGKLVLGRYALGARLAVGGPATEGTFEAIYTFVNHSGTARVRCGEPTADDFTIDMSWIAN